uniref:MarR family winged helix-turn-helix transcriptional regulator n=1 Tax=Anaerococcus mediterraneensis TaxID=1870984 RepID=UPI000931EF3F|nr:MarR family winged helix-turn-helix transcriptional regulator [Anaerococcus mediterraneensis]
MKNITLEDIITLSNINFYTRIFSNESKNQEKLTYTESMIVNIIDSLEKPTVNELVRILNVSQPNISYKINTLVSKGYVKKVQSKEDGREFILKLTNKFLDYKKMSFSFVSQVLKNLEKKLDDEQIKDMYKFLALIKEEMQSLDCQYSYPQKLEG